MILAISGSLGARDTGPCWCGDGSQGLLVPSGSQSMLILRAHSPNVESYSISQQFIRMITVIVWASGSSRVDLASSHRRFANWPGNALLPSLGGPGLRTSRQVEANMLAHGSRTILAGVPCFLGAVWGRRTVVFSGVSGIYGEILTSRMPGLPNPCWEAELTRVTAPVPPTMGSESKMDTLYNKPMSWWLRAPPAAALQSLALGGLEPSFTIDGKVSKVGAGWV